MGAAARVHPNPCVILYCTPRPKFPLRPHTPIIGGFSRVSLPYTWFVDCFGSDLVCCRKSDSVARVPTINTAVCAHKTTLNEAPKRHHDKAYAIFSGAVFTLTAAHHIRNISNTTAVLDRKAVCSSTSWPRVMTRRCRLLVTRYKSRHTQTTFPSTQDTSATRRGYALLPPPPRVLSERRHLPYTHISGYNAAEQITG